MLKNNNQIAVKRLSTRSLKQNRTRNLFAVLAIVLTTFMFTTVFSIGFSLAKNLNIMMLRQQGTKTTITLEQPEMEQIEQSKKAKNLYAAGTKIQTGVAADARGKTNILLDYYDNTEFEKNFKPAISDVKGTYPDNKNDIMLSKVALDALKIEKPEKGMDITLKTGSGEKTFQLSGWFTDYSYSAGGFRGLVSKSYVESLGLNMEEDGVLCLSAKTGRQSDLLDELESEVTLRKGQEFDAVFDAQEHNGGNVLVIASAIGLMGLIILLSGYLLIYNVMYISVTKDIRFYGMLKTIGTSPSQIKRIVKMQTAKLSLVGIPVGILLGTLTSFVVVPLALQIFRAGGNGVMPSDISFHPFIYIGTVLFAMVTVMISCRKPAKLASKVSAVEALKYHGQNAVKMKARKSTDGGKLYKMAFRNVFREKKRAFLVFASLFMGTIAFLSVDTFIGSMKLENYIDFYLPNDYTIYTNFNMDKTLKEKAEDLAGDIKKIEGITKVAVNRSTSAVLTFNENIFLPFLENDFTEGESLKEAIDFYKNNTDEETAYSSSVIAVSSEMMKQYNEKARQKIDIDRFEKGEVCLMGYVQTKEQSDAVKGKIIKLTDAESKKSIELEVGSCPIYGEDYGINIAYHWQQGGEPSCILISGNAIKRLCENPSVDNIIADCEPKAESSVTAAIKELVKINPAVRQTDIKAEMISDFTSSMAGMDILGGGISIVLILIGVINFINVMLTGVFTRRGELAVMESVGMTKKQVKKMLTYEGAYYGAITLALIFTAGNGIIYLIADLAQQTADYAVFHYPVVLMCVIAVIIMGICMFVPSVVYQMLTKESVTERLRNGG